MSLHIARPAATLAAIFGLLAATASAHQTSVPLTFWADNYDSPEARCQLEVGAGGATCGLRAWAIRRDCLLARMDDGGCDETQEEADDEAIQQLRLAIFQGDISPVCRQADLPKMLFSDLQDVQFDVVTFCRELEAAAVSVVFNPTFRVEDPTSLAGEEKACVHAFATATTKAFNFAFRARRATLDRIANRRRSSRNKNLDVDASNRSVSRANQALVESLANACAPASFEQLYGFGIEDAVALVTSRAACLADQTYPVLAYQDEYACPAAVCGNGMRETGERCDDGNTTDGDGCSSGCQLEF